MWFYYYSYEHNTTATLYLQICKMQITTPQIYTNFLMLSPNFIPPKSKHYYIFIKLKLKISSHVVFFSFTITIVNIAHGVNSTLHSLLLLLLQLPLPPSLQLPLMRSIIPLSAPTSTLRIPSRGYYTASSQCYSCWNTKLQFDAGPWLKKGSVNKCIFPFILLIAVLWAFIACREGRSVSVCLIVDQ